MENVKTKHEEKPDTSASRAARVPYISHTPFSILHPHFRKAFSFAEVMFAVVILGIGFIMVAAIFPVAIQQTQATSDDSAGASVAREASNAIAALPFTYTNATSTANTTVGGITYPATFPLLPPTVKNGPAGAATALPAVVVPFVGARFDAIKASLILPSNPRLAYIPFYMRDNSSSVAEMIVVAVATQNQSTYGSQDITPFNVLAGVGLSTANPAGLGNVTPGTITFTATPGWLGEGCFVTIPPTAVAAPLAGRTYLLGRQIQGGGATTFELAPSDGVSEAAGGNPTYAANDGLWNTSDDVFDSTNAVVGAYINYPSTLQPTVAYAKLSFPSDSTSGRITLANTLASGLLAATTPNTLVGSRSAAPGAFIIVSDDAPYGGIGATPAYAQPTTAVSAMYPAVGGVVPRLNGRIFRLGALIPPDSQTPPGTYELDPAYGITDSAVRVTALTVVSDKTNTDPATGLKYADDLWARVYIAGGKALSVTSDPTQPYTGAAQAVAAYTTFIPVK